MGEPMKKTSCQIACWAMGVGAGFVAFVMLLALGGWGLVQAVFGAAVVTVLMGGLLSWILCKPLPALGEVQAGMGEVDDSATSDAKPATVAASTATSMSATTSASATSAATAAPAVAPKAVAAAPVDVTSATPSDGENNPVARKGKEADKAVPAAASAPKAETAAKSAAKPKAEAKPKAATKAKAEAKPVVAEATPPAPEPAPASEGQGVKPATLTAARDGSPDDLKQIKGIGPKLETMLHGMGFFHFDQLSAWSATELAWVDSNLTGFKGRASRDNWVDQARVLASGGETEFSKRVGDGGVY